MLAVASTIALWPNALDRWVLPKVVVLGAAALVAVWVTPRGRLPRPLLVIGAVGILVLIVSALASPLPLADLLGRWPRYEGLISVTAYGLALWAGARLLGPTAAERERSMARYIVASVSTVLGIFSVLSAAGIELIPSNLARSGSLLGNATDQGAIGAAFALLLLAPTLRGPRRVVDLVGGALGIATVLASGSRAALIALLIGAVLLVIFDGLRHGWVVSRVLVSSTVVCVVVVLALTVPSIAPRVLGTSPMAAASAGDRPVIWLDAISTWLRHPFLGTGPSGFGDAVAAVHGTGWFGVTGQLTVLDSPHNFVLQALVVGGPLLLLALVAALTLCAVAVVLKARTTGRSIDFAIACAVAAIAIGIVLLTTPTSAGTMLFGALLLGAAVAEQPTAEARAFRIIRPIAIGVWLAFSVVALVAEVSLGSGVAAAASARYAKADADFTLSATLLPWDVDVPVIASQAFTKRLDVGDTAATSFSTTWARRALVADPNSLPAAKSAITTFLDAHSLSAAAKVTNTFARQLPNDPWIAERRGAISVLEGNYAVAETQLLAAAALDPTSPTPWQTLAYLYDQEGDSAKAQDAAAHAHALGG